MYVMRISIIRSLVFAFDYTFYIKIRQIYSFAFKIEKRKEN